MSTARSKKRRGSSLILVLAVLGCVVVLALTSLAILRVEEKASANHVDLVRARLVAQAGLARATAELSTTALHDPCAATQRLWIYPSRGVALERAGDLSYGRPADELGPLSGTLGSTHARSGDRYLLKVIDTSSKIDLNGPADIVAGCLDALGRAIAEDGRRAGRDVQDPVRGRGGVVADAIAARGGLDSIGQLSGLLGADDARALEDYVTVDAVRDSCTVRWTGVPDDDGHPVLISEPRAPICVNTAPWPVLVANFEGVTGRDGQPLDARAARRLADEIAKWRASKEVTRGPFKTWEGFARFVEDEGPRSGLTPGQCEAVLANASPHLATFALNPDAPQLRCGAVTSLARRTFELSLLVSGVFEVESLGRIHAEGGAIVAEARLRATVRAFETARHSTQLDFANGQAESVAPMPLPGRPAALAGFLSLAPRAEDPPSLGVVIAPSSGSLDASFFAPSSGPAPAPSASCKKSAPSRNVPKGNAWGFWKKRSAPPSQTASPPSAPGRSRRVFAPTGPLHADGLRIHPRIERPWIFALDGLPPAPDGRLAFWVKLGEQSSGEALAIEMLERLSDSHGVVQRLRIGRSGPSITVESERQLAVTLACETAPPPVCTTRGVCRAELTGRPHEWHRIAVDWHGGTETTLSVDGRSFPGGTCVSSASAVLRIPDLREAIAIGGSLDGAIHGGDFTIDGIVLDLGSPPSTEPGGDRYASPEATSTVGRFRGSLGPFEKDAVLGSLSWTVFRPARWGAVEFASDDFTILATLTVDGVELKKDDDDDGGESDDDAPRVATSGTTRCDGAPVKLLGRLAKTNARPCGAGATPIAGSGAPDVTWGKGRAIDYDFAFVYDRDALIARGVEPPPLNVSPVIEDVTLTYWTGPRVLRFEWVDE